MKDFLKYMSATVVGLIVFTLITGVIGTMCIVGMIASGSSAKDVSDNSVMVINLSGMLDERSESTFMDEINGNTVGTIGLDDVLSAIDKAKGNDKIKGIYIEAGMLSADSYASLAAIRNALLDFKKSGKWVVAYGDVYTQGVYYVASAADKVFLNPSGQVDWHGIASQPIFLKDVMAKFGVKMQLAKVGAYKSAPEMFTADKMSDANREQVTAYVNGLWQNVCKGVSESRKISVEQLNAYADSFVTLSDAKDFVRYKFVDKLMSLSVYALVLLMGLRMGADEEVTSSLGSIGIQALFVTVLTAAGSMLGAFAVRKLLHIDRHAHPAGAVVNEAEAVHEKADVSGVKMSFIILLMVVVGMLLGDLVIRRVCTDLPAFQSRSGDYLVVGLCIMLGLIGFSMGLDGSIARILRNAGLGVILVPIFAVLGTLLGGAVYAALSPMTLREGLAISAGFGWYTMAPSVIASAGHTMASAVSFLHNVLREMLGIILLPVIAGKIGYIEAITIPGTASTDVCLPIVEQVCNSETVAYSFCTGMLMCITSAALVPIIIGA